VLNRARRWYRAQDWHEHIAVGLMTTAVICAMCVMAFVVLASLGVGSWMSR
jgi:hypothetical protein